MRILIVANKAQWRSWQGKVEDLQDWFRPLVDIQFDIKHTDFTDIPFAPYQDGRLGVTFEWYDKNVLPLGIGYDMILFVLTLSQWKDPLKVRGWRTDSDQGPVELQVACDENEMMQWPNFQPMSAFFQIARHEILHGLFMISKQTDSVHFWWDRGQIEVARDMIRLPENWQFPMIARTLNYLFSLFAKLPEPMPKKQTTSPRILKWAQAIEKFESMNKSYNNPGALRYSPFQSGTKNGFAVFKTYEDGFNALVYQLQIAADGRSKVYKPTMTILQFFGLYAPVSDGNAPDGYARFVANYIGVPVSTQIRDLLN